MMPAEIDGLRVMEAPCEKGHPFHMTSSALPLFHVLHLKEKQMVYEFLDFLKFHYPCFPG